MFEKATPVSIKRRAPAGGFRRDERESVRRSAAATPNERFDSRSARRAGDALRAVAWSEITARLNAARDLRLLLRNETQAPIEAAAASFGDAAASYFALLDHDKPNINLDDLEQSKVLGTMIDERDANRLDNGTEETSGAAQGDAREMQ